MEASTSARVVPPSSFLASETASVNPTEAPAATLTLTEAALVIALWSESSVADSVTVGAETTTLSRTIASCLPTSRVVTSANVFAPAPFRVKLTCQPGVAVVVLPAGTYTAVAFESAAPVIYTGPSLYFVSVPAS